jgi:prolyl oligopeptidase
MHRYHKLLAGASWVAEYGDPDDEQDGAYIRSISPYQNIKEKEDYPVMFLNTSTKDDRVHPGHARKFAAKLFEYDHPVYYYENMVGGHGGASNFKEFAFLHALNMCFFWNHLK